MITRVPFKWNTADFNWDATDPTEGKTYPPNERVTGTNNWDDCALIIEILEGIGGKSPDDYFYNKPEKKEKFIKLLCKVQGKEYKETHKVKDVKVKAKDVELVIKEVLNIDIRVK